MQRLLVLIFLLLCACQPKSRQVEAEKSAAPTETSQLDEYFVDSLTIGIKAFNKVELSMYRTPDSVFVNIKFYSKQRDLWVLKNEFHFLKDPITSCSPVLKDFNNDGLNDLTYQSSIAARGANNIRKLFIYDKKSDELLFIKNSEAYPNLLYNEKLDCIDAFLVTGSSTTVFLKLEGDHLRKFASVDLSDGLTVWVYDKNGIRKIIRQDSMNEGSQVRYKNFRPLEVNEEY